MEQKNINEVLTELNVNPEIGLTNEEVEARKYRVWEK